MQRFVDEGLAHLRGEFVDTEAQAAIAAAIARHASRPEVPHGPTFNEIMRTRASKVSDEQIKAWRKTEATRLTSLRSRYEHDLSRHSPGSPGHETAKMLLAQVDDAQAQVRKAPKGQIALRVVMDGLRESAEMRRLQTQFVSVDPYAPDTD